MAGGASVVRGAKPKSAASFPSRPPAVAVEPTPIRRECWVASDLPFEVLDDPVDRVGEVAEDEHLALVAGVILANALILGLRSDRGELARECAQLRVILLRDARDLSGEAKQQLAIVLDVGAKRVDVVGCGRFEVGTVAGNELVERVEIV